MPHRQMPLDAHILYFKLVFYVLEKNPAWEQKVLKAVLKALCAIDVEISVPAYKTKTHKNVEVYQKELRCKLLTEKEIKLGCLV